MKYPEPVVGAVVVNTQGRILLITSPKWSGKYVVPGGHIELGEKIEDALRREIKEEAGIDVYDIQLLGVADSVESKEFHTAKHFIFLDFVCKTNDKEVSLNDEGTSFIWSKIEETSDLPLAASTKNLLAKYKEYLKK